jgi:hypothetical protein
LTSALFEVAREGRTNDEHLSNIFRAQKVNEVMGGMALMPWDVGDLPDEWMDVFCGLTDELPKLKAMSRQQEQTEAGWLAKNGYRNYLKR